MTKKPEYNGQYNVQSTNDGSKHVHDGIWVQRLSPWRLSYFKTRPTADDPDRRAFTMKTGFFSFLSLVLLSLLSGGTFGDEFASRPAQFVVNQPNGTALQNIVSTKTAGAL
jgi:hypothetical protein